MADPGSTFDEVVEPHAPQSTLAAARRQFVPNTSGLSAVPARLPDPKDLATRRWLLGTVLVRGFISVLVAPRGCWQVGRRHSASPSVASGRSLVGDHVWETGNVWILNLEDPLEEIERRVAAAMLHHGIGRR